MVLFRQRASSNPTQRFDKQISLGNITQRFDKHINQSNPTQRFDKHINQSNATQREHAENIYQNKHLDHESRHKIMRNTQAQKDACQFTWSVRMKNTGK